jgi:hypothetical protein
MLDTRCSILDTGFSILDGNVGYKTLEVWQLARDLVIDIHRLTIEKLPKFEMFEEGSQIRRSVKSVLNGWTSSGEN